MLTSFCHYPQGVNCADQTQRLRKLAAIYWALGMSLRSVTIALDPFGVKLSHMSAWRDLQEQADLLAELPPQGSRRLFELWKQIPERRTGQVGSRSPLEQPRYLLIRFSEHWASYRVFDWQKDVPWTNNSTEQTIGRMQMRSRTVRGYKSWPGMWAGLMLSGSGPAW